MGNTKGNKTNRLSLEQKVEVARFLEGAEEHEGPIDPDLLADQATSHFNYPVTPSNVFGICKAFKIPLAHKEKKLLHNTKILHTLVAVVVSILRNRTPNPKHITTLLDYNKRVNGDDNE